MQTTLKIALLSLFMNVSAFSMNNTNTLTKSDIGWIKTNCGNDVAKACDENKEKIADAIKSGKIVKEDFLKAAQKLKGNKEGIKELFKGELTAKRAAQIIRITDAPTNAPTRGRIRY